MKFSVENGKDEIVDIKQVFSSPVGTLFRSEGSAGNYYIVVQNDKDLHLMSLSSFMIYSRTQMSHNLSLVICSQDADLILRFKSS